MCGNGKDKKVEQIASLCFGDSWFGLMRVAAAVVEMNPNCCLADFAYDSSGKLLEQERMCKHSAYIKSLNS